MPINAAKPVTKPAEGEKTYDNLWLSHFQVQAGDPTRPVRVIATLEKTYQDPATGAHEKAPPGMENARGTLLIDDLYKDAATDAVTVTLPATLGGAGPAVTLSMADIIAALLLKVKQKAEAAGVV